MYKNSSEERDLFEEVVNFMPCLVPLKLDIICLESDSNYKLGKCCLIFHFYCRPLRFSFIKETIVILSTENDSIDSAKKCLKRTVVNEECIVSQEALLL